MHRLGFVLAFFALNRLDASDWFVAPNGNDAWSGKVSIANADRTDGPFATPVRARDAMRAARKAGDTAAATVHLRTGVYEVRGTLALSAEDSGTAAAPTVWRAFESEKPVLVGGHAITGWKPWKGTILQTDMDAQGMKSVHFKQLFFAGQRQHLARYPNYDPQNPYGGGWAYAGGEPVSMYAEREGEDKSTLVVKPQDWRTWKRPEGVELFIFPRYNWFNKILPIRSVATEKKTVTTGQDAYYAMRPNDRYFFQGAIEELDAPGEWYLDEETWTLYFQPPAPIESAPVYVPSTRDIVKIDGGEYITLRGLTFECADGNGVVLENAKHCRVIGSTVRNVGGDFFGSGITVAGSDNGIIGCDISATGRDGIALDGGDRPTLTAAGNFADNCYIHHVGVFHKGSAGVALGGVGQSVTHCLIHDTPRFAIKLGGNNQLIEFNHIRHVALETEDVGAVYSDGQDFLSPRGSTIRFNFIHDVLGYGYGNGKWNSPYLSWGIYLDNGTNGVDVIGNVVARCGRALIYGHSPRDCRVVNNVFVEGRLRQWEFTGWTTKTSYWNDSLPTMEKGFQSVAGQPAWKGVRGMAVPPQNTADSEGRVMNGNMLMNNIFAWKNPEATGLNVVAFNPERNQVDRNLYWHDGMPMKTGQRSAGKVIGSNRAPNPSFTGEVGKLPRDWEWQVRPTPTAKAGLAKDGNRRCLRIDATIDHNKTQDNYPIVVSREVELKPGAAYRLRAQMRGEQEGAKASLSVQFYLPTKPGEAPAMWRSSPSEVKLTTTWQPYEFSFKIPARGEKGWHEKMRNFRIRIDWPAEDGQALFADGVVLEQTESLDEWQSWQALGSDRQSIIADPKFVAPQKDDYRLAPTSPAWALGFRPIPVEKIGPYASPDRASWPIVEAAGAREHPLAP